MAFVGDLGVQFERKLRFPDPPVEFGEVFTHGEDEVEDAANSEEDQPFKNRIEVEFDHSRDPFLRVAST